MPYTKTPWAQGHRLSIERLNKLEDGIVAAAMQNATNESAALDTDATLGIVEGTVDRIESLNANGQQILSQIDPPTILSDSWGYFDGASIESSSSVTGVTRAFSGFVTRVGNTTLYQNNGNSIRIKQSGTYMVMRTARVAASDGYWDTIDYKFQVFMFGGGGSGYRIVTSITSFDIITVGAAGLDVEMRVTLSGGNGVTAAGNNGKVAIRKIA